MQHYSTDAAFAASLDQRDPLRTFKERFYIPKHSDGSDLVYLTGNSLGLQPKTTQRFVMHELDAWQKHAVEAHFTSTPPWYSYHETVTEDLASIAGAKPSEVVAMGSLSANLHFLMVTFFRPTKERYKIVMEANAFPSDIYAVKSQLAYHGINPEEGLLVLSPQDGTDYISRSDVDALFAREGSRIAVVLMGGVNYYTGQAFDMRYITERAHAHGAVAGFDLAHAMGNLDLKLHDWNVDFAAWCSYKYLNAGPGGMAGVFINERHVREKSAQRFAGWWGHNKHERFKMLPEFDAMPTAEGWQHSNPNILALACLRASLAEFREATMPAIRSKSRALSEYAAFLFRDLLPKGGFIMITPESPDERGAQISLRLGTGGKAVQQALTHQGIVADWREPDTFRFAATGLYNTFSDVHRLAAALREQLGRGCP